MVDKVYTNVRFFYDWVIETVCERWPEDSPEYMGCFANDSTESPTQPTITAQPASSGNTIELVSMTPPDGTLKHCQGSCSGDESCVSDLVCYERGSSSSSGIVPGCTDTGIVATDVNICVNMTVAAEGLLSSGSNWWSSNP
jgi:hypothetical protein